MDATHSASGLTLLMACAARGLLAHVERLLQLGADPLRCVPGGSASASAAAAAAAAATSSSSSSSGKNCTGVVSALQLALLERQHRVADLLHAHLCAPLRTRNAYCMVY